MAGFRCALWVVIMIYMVYYISKNNGCLEEERIGLLGLRELLESNGADSAKYLRGLKRNCCEWERVTCDPTTGHVTELFLHSLGVDKEHEINFDVWTINCSLFLPFRDLRTLNLSSNSFGQWNNHHGFERLSALKKLEKIDISQNYFDNTIFKSLGAVTSLKALLLSNNRLGGSFPAHELVGLENLEMLDLSYNGFENWLPKQGFEKLSLFRKLERLNLSYNILTVEVLPFLNSFTSLKVLNLCASGFWGSFPAQELGDLRNLESLDLSFNSLSGIQGLESLARFKKLTSLNLSYNRWDISYNGFNRSLFLSLSPVTSLKNLFLASTYEADTFPARELSALENMEMLDLRDNGLSSLTEEDCELLSKLNKMRHLDLSNNAFDKGVFRILDALPSLRFLSLTFNQLEGTISNQDLTSNHSSLEVLLLNNNKLKGSLPVEGLSVLKNLEMLDLSGNGFSSLTTQDCEILSKLSKMRHLDLSSNSFDKGAFRIKGVFRILDALPSLRFLSLSYNNLEGSISNQDLTHNHSSLEVLLLKQNRLNGSLPVEGLASFRFLEVLDLSQNSFFGSIPSSIRNLSSLKVISLADNYLEGSLPDQGLCELQQLEELDISGNFLEGILPSCLSNLKSIRLLDLSLNQFTGNLSSSLLSSISLEYIDLSRNFLEGTFSFSSLANHSNLVVIDISSDNGKLVVETEDVDWFPMFQLNVLFLSNCNLNRLSKKILPKFLIHQHKLMDLDLSNNSLNDLFPNWLLVNNTILQFFNVRNNSLSGTFYLPSVQSPQTLDCSDNQLSGKIQANIGNVFSVFHFNLSNNAFEGSIPSSLGVMSMLRTLDLSSNRLSGEAPWKSFGNCTTLEYLSLSNNSLHGQISSSDFNFTQLLVLQLGNNQFTGPLPTSFLGSGLKYLDVSNNNLSGEVSGEFPTWETVILSNNSFDGEFPCSLVPTTFMDISYNSFSGPISSCSNQNLEIVNHLHLQGNKFTGPIPQGFLNSSALLTLDVNDNRFSGTIPMLLAPSPDLRIFLARGNLLNGSIPSHLCRLNKISLMDLSNNLFTGSIPRCLTNISFESFVPFLEYPIRSNVDLDFYPYEGILSYSFEKDNFGGSLLFGKGKEVNFVTKGHTYSYRLNAMSGLDLSCNNLTGEIPSEIGYLSAIRAMNLSRNHLTGPIPKTLSNLKQVESLDLSYNNLAGNIPFELTNLNFLAVFSVANNNLSGIIPNGKAQFDSFDASCYDENPGLCGPPLEKSCNTIDGTEIVPTDSSDERESKWFGVDRVVVAVFGISYISFFVGTLTVLYINPNWRNRCYDLLEEGFYSTYFYFSKLCR